jgi:hypothetical protein
MTGGDFRRVAVQCGNCKQRVVVPLDSTGSGKCPSCGQRFRAKLPDASPPTPTGPRPQSPAPRSPAPSTDSVPRPSPQNAHQAAIAAWTASEDAAEATSESNWATERSWEVLAEDNQVYGPYLLEEVLEYIQVGRIAATTVLRHPVETSGQPLWANAIPLLTKHFSPLGNTPPRPAAALGDRAAHRTPPAEGRFSFEAALRQVKTASSKLGDATAKFRSRDPDRPAYMLIIDLLDPTFRYYLTPLIIKIQWGAIVGGVLLMLVLYLVAEYTPESLREILFYGLRPTDLFSPSRPNELVLKFFRTVFTVILSVGVLLWARVVLESVIVIFDISNSLKSIDSKAGESDS